MTPAALKMVRDLVLRRLGGDVFQNKWKHFHRGQKCSSYFHEYSLMQNKIPRKLKRPSRQTMVRSWAESIARIQTSIWAKDLCNLIIEQIVIVKYEQIRNINPSMIILLPEDGSSPLCAFLGARNLKLLIRQHPDNFCLHVRNGRLATMVTTNGRA